MFQSKAQDLEQTEQLHEQIEEVVEWEVVYEADPDLQHLQDAFEYSINIRVPTCDVLVLNHPDSVKTSEGQN